MLQTSRVKNLGKTIKLNKIGDDITVRASVCPYKPWEMGGESESNLNREAQEFHLLISYQDLRKNITAPVL